MTTAAPTRQDTAAEVDAEVDPGADPVTSMFASGSVTEHVVRGVLGLVLVVAAFALAGSRPVALLLLVPAVVAWRGCPTCWLMGLGATLSRGRVGGSCRLPR